MGTVASLQKEDSPSRGNEKAVTAENVRRRLHHEYYGHVDNVQDGEEANRIGMAEVPYVLKAKGAFLKGINKGSSRGNEDDSNLIKKQDNNSLLKEIFNRIDPSAVYGSYGKIFGELEISMKYKSNESTLLVKIGRAKNLQTPDVHKLPDPFVKASLVIKRLGEQAAQVHSTKVKSNTQNPLFQEILTFDLLQADLVDARLVVDVWNKDCISKDDFLGEAILELFKEEVNGGVAVWYKLKQKVDLGITGHLEVTLEYSDNKLYVDVHQATGLKPLDSGGDLPNPFVRSYIPGVSKRDETKVVTNNLDPVFDETFEYEILPEVVRERVLVLNVLHKDAAGSKGSRLGDVLIPLKEVNFSNPDRVLYQLADLRNTPHSRNKWSEEGLSQEFKEAMRAHALYQYPHCLFKGKHNGRKLVSVSCTKASSSAKMTIVNGLPLRE